MGEREERGGSKIKGSKKHEIPDVQTLMQQLKVKDEQILALQTQVDELTNLLKKEREERAQEKAKSRKGVIIGRKDSDAIVHDDRPQSPPPLPPKDASAGSASSLFGSNKDSLPLTPQNAELRNSHSDMRSQKKAMFAKDEKLVSSNSTGSVPTERRVTPVPKNEVSSFTGISGFFKRSKSTSVHMSLTSNITTTIPQQFGVPLPDRDLSPLIRTTLSYLSNINRLELLTSEIGAEQVTSLKVMYETGQVAQMGGWEALNEPLLVAGLIRHYFVQLPEPCVPRSLQGALFGCAGCTNQSVRASAFHTLMYRMPPSNRLLFITTMLHLDQILLSKERTPSIKDLQNLVAKSPRASLPNIQIQSPVTPRAMAQVTARAEIPRLRELALTIANVWGPLFCAPDNNSQLESSIRFLEKLILDWPQIQRIEELMQFDEDENLFKLGAIDCVIAKLADVPPRRAAPGGDSDFADMILSTHRYFMHSYDLAQRLATAWSKLEGSDPWQRELQERVVHLLTLLLGTHSTTITDDERAGLTQCLASFLSSLAGGPFAHEAEKLKRTLKVVGERSPIPKREGPRRHVILKLLDLNPESIATQLSMLDSEHFLALPESELLLGNFKHKERSPHYTLMMERFNLVSQWVASEIVGFHDMHDRISALAVMVNVAKYCASYGNYHSSYAVYAGLNLPPITRMKETWSRLPKKAADRYEKLTRLFNTKKNYLNYRKELAERSDAVIPILSLYPKFYTSIEENHASIVESPLYPDVELVNLAKLRMLWKVTAELKDFQARWTVSGKHGTFASFTPKEGTQSSAIAQQDLKDYLGGVLPVRSEDEQFSLSLQVRKHAILSRLNSLMLSRLSHGSKNDLSKLTLY